MRAQGPPPGDDGDLVDGIGAGNEPGHQGVAGFVVGGIAPFPLAQDEALALRAHEDLVLGVLEVLHGKGLPLPRRAANKAASLARFSRSAPENPGVPRARMERSTDSDQGGAPGVDLEDGLPAFEVRDGDHHLAVEAAGPQQGGVQDVRAVGGGNEDNPFVGLEAVHLHQELVQGLFPLVVTATQAGAPMAAHGVDFIDEDDAGGVFLGLDEQVPHPGSAHAHEHLHEVGTADAEEGNPRFAGDGPGQEGLAGARGAHQENTLGDAAPQAGKFLGVFEEFDDLRRLLPWLPRCRPRH